MNQSNHTIRELQQVNMLLKKIVRRDDNTSSSFEHRINELEQITLVAKKILNDLPESSHKISPRLLEKIHNDLKTPLTPVKAYCQLLMSDNFGNMTDLQKEKMKLISKNIDQLESSINKLF